MDAIGLIGHTPDDPEDPFVLVSGALLDQPRLPGPIPKERREDIQALSFMQVLALIGAPSHPLGISEGSDPPDRFVESSIGVRWGLELTELTLPDLRADLARIRRVGRDLEAALQASGRHHHLDGRVVQISAPEENLPRATEPLIADLAEALAADKGYTGEGVDFSEGLPEQLPQRGLYGDVGPVSVIVGGHGSPGVILVSAGAQGELRQSEVIGALEDRAAAKDVQPNQVLLISCGLPDERGYVCPADGFIFQILREAREKQGVPASLIPKPTFLDGVVLHDFASGNLLEIFRRPGAALPWREPAL